MIPRRYHYKPLEVEAVQYDGTLASVGEILKWADGSGVYWRYGRLIVTTIAGQGDRVVIPSEMIVRIEPCVFEVWAAHLFARTFEPSNTPHPRSGSMKFVATMYYPDQWFARDEDQGDTSPVGIGRTEAGAIQDLREQIADRAEAMRSGPLPGVV